MSGLVLGTAALVFVKTRSEVLQIREVFTKNKIADILAARGVDQKNSLEYPVETEIEWEGRKEKIILQYSFDAALQGVMQKNLEQYAPDYGAFVAMDATTGRILSMLSYTGAHSEPMGNLAVRATFPSASVFKVVTAAAAIEERKFTAYTMIPYQGANHTLLKRQIFQTPAHRWLKQMSLREAFAKSVNPIFGKIGAFELGAEGLKNYADRFAFNRKIASDIPIQQGQALISDEKWSLAETGSGYTLLNRMSPLQGALIASAVVNNGIMMEPFGVQSVHSENGSTIYTAQPKMAWRAIDQKTSMEMRNLMRETVVGGTSRKSFRRFFKGKYVDLDVGGKTGTLTGDSPAGKYDWFIGYAERGDQRIAFAALTIHKQFWKVKSAYLARLAVENYFGRAEELAQK